VKFIGKRTQRCKKSSEEQLKRELISSHDSMFNCVGHALHFKFREYFNKLSLLTSFTLLIDKEVSVCKYRDKTNHLQTFRFWNMKKRRTQSFV